MRYSFYRPYFLLVLLSLFVANVGLKAQVPIPGYYNNYYFLGYTNHEITFELDGHFKCTLPSINSARAFYGSWTRINDSTVKLQADTALTFRFPRYQILREFYCVQAKEDTMLIRCYFSKLDTSKKDTVKFRELFYRVSSFRSDGEFKEHTNYFKDNIKVVTTFYPNGNTKEITAYRKGLIHGNSLHYDVNGNLYIISYYKKGKFIREFYCPKCRQLSKDSEYRSE